MNTPQKNDSQPLVLLTGASGYIGGRLLRTLQARRVPVRCLARRPEYLMHHVQPPTEVIKGDVFDVSSLAKALDGVHTAYYLVHTLAAAGSFERNDRTAAENFGAAARAAGVQRIIYLGGLGKGYGLSHHLSSRQEVGQILRDSGTPTIEFQASIVIGSGSLSFEMIRALTQKLPLMTTPQWVRALAQPIAIEDVVTYLTGALDYDSRESCIFEIGGADKISYEGIMREYIHVRGLKRLIIPLPFLTPWLSSLWLALVTPLYFRVGRRLIEGVRSETTISNDTAANTFGVKPLGIRRAIERALENEDLEFAETRWSDALPDSGVEHYWGGVRFGSRLLDSQEISLGCPPAKAFRPIQCIGGKSGWYGYSWMWNLRGFIDRLVGGVGNRHGRDDPRCLRPGDTVDCWRVEALEPDSLLRLRAEMKMPGRGWLQFEITPVPGGSVVRQTAIFDPIGLAGLMYWYALYPFHTLIFKRMLKHIATVAESGPRLSGHAVD